MPDHGAAFDHLIHWVPDLDDAMAKYGAVGLTTRPALTMPGFRNAAWGVDDERYVELATVDDWNAVRTSKYAGSLEILKPVVDAVDASGLVTFAVDVPDARVIARQLLEAGRDVDEIEVYLEDRGAGFVEVFVRDAPTYFPFFITYSPPRAEIGRMRAEYRQTQGISLDGAPDLVALLIRSVDPYTEAQHLAELVGCPVRGTTVALPGAEVRFERGAEPGLHGIVVRGLGNAPTAIEMLGMTVIVER
ncbi:VOC family protein [Gordonia sp. VNQ95]|jgi:hypothetical protein|uniref:VOC family protein n=1 Tax=Gordonia TaxID=2053 RepID=UPI0032B35C56